MTKVKRYSAKGLKTLLLGCVLLLSNALQAQLKQKEIDFLCNRVNELVNGHRQNAGLKDLALTESLQNAAQWHSDYMAKTGELGHTEKKSAQRTPDKRVKFFKGEHFELIEENVQGIEGIPKKRKKAHLELLALTIYDGLTKDRLAVERITETEFQLCGYGFQYDPQRSKIYVTQVLGKMAFEVPNQLSKNGFGIRYSENDCRLDVHSNVINNLGNALCVSNDTILLKHHDLEDLKRLLTGAQDGFAIDLIHRSQLECGKSNELDGSPVYDGILLKPVYRDEVFRRNIAGSNYRYIGAVGILPPGIEYNDEEWAISLVVLKNNTRCSYIIPMYCEQRNYRMVDVDPVLVDEPDLTFKNAGVVKTQTLHYNFRTSDNQAMEFPHIDEVAGKIYRVDITSYSSIDGDSLRNIGLYNQRAATICQHIQSKLKVADNKFRVIGKENWEELTFQLHMLQKEDWLPLSRDTLRYFARNLQDSLNWDSLLFLQRQSSANIHYWDKFDPKKYPGETMATMNLRTAVILNDPRLANKALYAMYQDKSVKLDILFEPEVLRFFEIYPECVGNYAAMLCKAPGNRMEEVTRFLHRWIQVPTRLSETARTNLTILYTYISAHYIDEWDVHTSRLANVVHPRKFDPTLPAELSTNLLMNLRISYINYFGQINDYPAISEVFDELDAHFIALANTEEEDIALTAFYNYWSSYESTVNYLIEQFRKGKLSHDRLFMLNFTMNRIDALRDDESYLQVHQAAIESNAELWCWYVNTYFQILRDYRIKRLFCENCN